MIKLHFSFFSRPVKIFSFLSLSKSFRFPDVFNTYISYPSYDASYRATEYPKNIFIFTNEPTY